MVLTLYRNGRTVMDMRNKRARLLVVLVVLCGLLTVAGVRPAPADALTGSLSFDATAPTALGRRNSVRFLLSWASAEPANAPVDTTYLANATAHMPAFLDAGIR